jgi:hypothetical protein
MTGHFTETADGAQVCHAPQAFSSVAVIEPFLYVTRRVPFAQRLELQDGLKEQFKSAD